MQQEANEILNDGLGFFAKNRKSKTSIEVLSFSIIMEVYTKLGMLGRAGRLHTPETANQFAHNP